LPQLPLLPILMSRNARRARPSACVIERYPQFNLTEAVARRGLNQEWLAQPALLLSLSLRKLALFF